MDRASGAGPSGGPGAHRIDEIEVTMRIREGKITAESKSGPKNGALELDGDGSSVELVLEGAGSDRSTATLSRPELSRFRTMIDAALSEGADATPEANDRRILYSGYRPLGDVGGATGMTFDEDALRALGIVDGSGNVLGGGREVQCTVLESGVAIVNLAADSDPFDFSNG